MDRRLLLTPEGGSLNTIEVRGDVIVKAYTGTKPRGYEKLIAEYAWLTTLPENGRAYFNEPVRFTDVSEGGTRRVELHLRAVPGRSVAKAILLGEIDPELAGRALREGLSLERDHVWDTRTAFLGGPATYQRYHGQRVGRAVRELAEVESIRRMIGPALRVNGLVCPSIPAIVEMLNEFGRRWELPSRLVAAHGDTHLDNLLIGPSHVVWCDPRGESVLPASYDFGKSLKACRAWYDLIHYEMYEMTRKYNSDGNEIVVSIEVMHDRDAHFATALEELIALLPSFAEAEALDTCGFLRRALVAEIAHVLSFAWYHANRPQAIDPERVRAYLVVAALLARRLCDDQGWTEGYLRTPLLTSTL